MLFDNSREALRQQYRQAWQKQLKQQTLQPLEQQIVDVIAKHPEYQDMLMDEAITDKDFIPEAGAANPFLHMGLHLGLQEQLQTNRPVGILDIYQQLCTKMQDHHQAEHLMMECLAETLWQAQRDQVAPDERVYLQCLQSLL